jgi:parallel beta-helix repeat protein
MKITKLLLLVALLYAPVITRAVTFITSLPYTITTPGEYELKDNLTANGTSGIDINASNVSINLAGYTITGVQTSGQIGINVFQNNNNVSIQNGTITGFLYGVAFDSDSGLVLKNVQLLGISGTGVYVAGANSGFIENCLIVGMGGADIGIYVQTSSNILVKNNQVSEISSGAGIATDIQSTITLIGNYEANCAAGLNLFSSKYQGNIITNCPTPVIGGVAVGQENG